MNVRTMEPQLDHVILGCPELEAGVAVLSDAFGASPAGRGFHEKMGTHNALWNMGDAYIELIAIDPAAPPPGRPRWYGLDDPGFIARMAGGPRLLTWSVASSDPAGMAAASPEPFSAPEDFARDDLRWRMAVPAAGTPAMDGAFPAPIEWIAGVHPAKRLGDQGLRCAKLTISHPDVALIAEATKGIGPDVDFDEGPANLTLALETQAGPLIYRAFA